MSRPKLSSPDQPVLVRWLLRLYEFAASLGLAVVLIFVSALALGLATFVEAAYGTPAVQFYVYQTWWFEAILVLLAINIFCAAAIRYPWKRYQTGFVITHIGLLTLLFGAFISRTKGIDAQVTVFEGEADKWAVENAVNLQLNISRASASSEAGLSTTSEHIHVNFRPGLFNWEDWSKEFAFNKPEDNNIEGIGRLPWKLFRWGTGQLFRLAGQHGPGDVLYNRDGVKLEVLDYYSDSREVQAPHVKLELSMPTDTRIGADGALKATAVQWVPAELSVVALPSQPEYPYGWCQRTRAGGGYLTLQLAGSEAQTESFLKSLPDGELGEKGQAVIYAAGQITRISVDEKLGQGRFKLAGDSGLEAEVTEYWPSATLADAGSKFEWRKDEAQAKPVNPAVKIAVYKGDKKLSDLLLIALESQSSIVDHENQLFGEYWFNHSEKGPLSEDDRKAAGISARIDLLQGADKKLYYRYWNREKVVFARELPTDGSKKDAVDAFTMPIGTLKMYVTQFIPSDKPAVVPAKHQFTKDRLIGDPMQMGRIPAARFALTVDGEREEFWLFPFLSTPDAPPVNREGDGKRIQMITTSNRIAAVTMPIEAVDIGFRVKLNKFERKLDPGTEQASHYSSWVDFIDHKADRAVTRLTKTGGKPEMVISDKLISPRAIAFSGDKTEELWWADDRRGEILSAAWNWKPKDKKITPEMQLNQAVGRPTAIATHADRGEVYFADRVPAGGRRETGVIRVLKQGKPSTVAELAYVPQLLALDSQNNFLYFTARSQNSIGRVNLTSGEVEPSWFRGVSRPVGLAVDAKNGQLLWSEHGQHAIRRVKLDGTGEGLFLGRGDKDQPLELAIDRQGERVYFFESLPAPQTDKNGLPLSKPQQWRLVSAKLDGSDVRIESEQGIYEPQGLTFNAANEPAWTQATVTRSDVWITMNAPVDCFDPLTGRSYRLFQERFAGPFKPGQALSSTLKYEDLVPSDSLKSELYESILTVNYDPGRGIRNVGNLLVCLGILTMFYMRAYFFKKPKAATAERAAAPAPKEEKIERSAKKQRVRN
jgi:DNA-binding beta-propeller fold protein YncE